MNRELPDELISAFIDGELTAAQHAEVEAALTENAELRHACEELRALRDEFQRLPRFQLDGDFAARVLRRAERTMCGDGESDAAPAGETHSGGGESLAEEAGDSPLAQTPPVAPLLSHDLLEEHRRAERRWRRAFWCASSVAALLLAALVYPRLMSQSPLGSVAQFDDANSESWDVKAAAPAPADGMASSTLHFDMEATTVHEDEELSLRARNRTFAYGGRASDDGGRRTSGQPTPDENDDGDAGDSTLAKKTATTAGADRRDLNRDGAPSEYRLGTRATNAADFAELDDIRKPTAGDRSSPDPVKAQRGATLDSGGLGGLGGGVMRPSGKPGDEQLQPGGMGGFGGGMGGGGGGVESVAPPGAGGARPNVPRSGGGPGGGAMPGYPGGTPPLEPRAKRGSPDGPLPEGEPLNRGLNMLGPALPGMSNASPPGPPPGPLAPSPPPRPVAATNGQLADSPAPGPTENQPAKQDPAPTPASGATSPAVSPRFIMLNVEIPTANWSDQSVANSLQKQGVQVVSLGYTQDDTRSYFRRGEQEQTKDKFQRGERSFGVDPVVTHEPAPQVFYLQTSEPEVVVEALRRSDLNAKCWVTAWDAANPQSLALQTDFTKKKAIGETPGVDKRDERWMDSKDSPEPRQGLVAQKMESAVYLFRSTDANVLDENKMKRVATEVPQKNFAKIDKPNGRAREQENQPAEESRVRSVRLLAEGVGSKQNAGKPGRNANELVQVILIVHPVQIPGEMPESRSVEADTPAGGLKPAEPPPDPPERRPE